MELVSACPLPVAPLLWQPRPGAFCLTVVCKATFLLEPSRARLAPTQEPVRDADAFSPEGARSLRWPSDLAPQKARVDVVLVGHAFAPAGEPVRALTARLVVGGLDKAIDVVCDRALTRDGALREGAPFARMPLVYERAAGGPETWNPAGMRSDAWTAEGLLALPNLQPRGRRAAGAFEPLGFGPIPASWPSRRDKLGRHPALAETREWRSLPLPADLDFGFFNVAPPDQQLASLDDEVRIALEHLHPERLLLVTRLPGVRPKALVDRPGQAPQRMVLRADTLWIDTDRALCTVTYRGQVPLAHPEEAGRVLVTLMRTDEGSSGPETPRAPAPRRSSAPPPLSEETEAAPIPVFAPAPSAPVAWSAGRSLWPRSIVPPVGSEDETPAPPTMDLLPTLAPPPSLSPPTIAPPPTISPPPTIAPPPTVVAPPPSRVLPTISPPRLESSPPQLAEGEALELLWYARESVRRIRRGNTWRAILEEASAEPIDPDLDPPDPGEAENRRDLAAILARETPASPEALPEVLGRSIRAATLAPALALVGGHLVFPLDEAQRLKALVLVATPLAAGDERLRAALRAAGEFVDLPGSSHARAVVERLGARIKEILRQGPREVSFAELEAQAERAALEQRAYQKRLVLGGAHLRALLVAEAAPQALQAGVPVYLPERLAAELPLLARFKARILAEVLPQVDGSEAQSVALRAVAVGRIVALGGRG